MILCDTGPLVAVASKRDEHHRDANDLFRDLHMSGETILVPSTVLTETCCWLDNRIGSHAEASFLDAVADGTFTLAELTPDALIRRSELVRTFASFPLGATEASVVAVAERLGFT